MNSLPVGKLELEYLAQLLSKYIQEDNRVLAGPGIGEDATVIDFGDRYLVAKTDPITFATDEIGWYAVHVNANDIATAGAEPKWLLVTLLLPEGQADRALVEKIFSQLSEACKQIGVSLCGGHTEVTYNLDRPIVVGQMLGEVAPDRLVTSSGARTGDVIILTKGVAVEGTAIIAREKAPELADEYSAEFLDRCRNFLRDPGISILREARIAVRTARVQAMHDPTEGGLATGLWELAQASGVGLRIERAAIPILPETAALCSHYELNPLGIIASGSLLLALAPEDAQSVIAALRSEGIPAAVIGEAVPREEGLTLIMDGKAQELSRFEPDEIARLFA
ncbi:MAG: AIR synthase family protein [Chloroflexota bacterium]|nr:AIR synthase family protein [Chloroflexota bacterium]